MRDTDRALVQAATAVAKLRCRSAHHGFAAAARTSDGRVVTGVDVRHASGGACAELVVIGTAATQGVGVLETIVVVGDRGREVLTPCESCRQVLFGSFPELRVILGPTDALRVEPLRHLLPAAHPGRGPQPPVNGAAPTPVVGPGDSIR